MLMRLVLSMMLSFPVLITTAQRKANLREKYRVLLHRDDGRDIVFNFLVKDSAESKHLYIVNGSERIPTENLQLRGDSVFFHMQVFESSFRARIDENGIMHGTWIVQQVEGFREMPFTALPANYRFQKTDKKGGTTKVGGRWAVTFSRLDTNRTRPAVAELAQNGQIVTGSFLTLSGDMRYLEGVVNGDSLKLSTFDGHHAYLLVAKITPGGLLDGMFYSGAERVEKWVARRDPDATLPEQGQTQMREGETMLNFRFPDLDSNIVSINDERFRNKVVIVQIMGSWCANCMDEVRFLSDYYLKNKERGFEVVSLCYERSTNFARSVASIKRFQQRFNVQYPMLVTGVTSADPAKTEKTLPQLDKINAFPSFLVLNKKGEVVHIHTGFEGPGTGIHYEKFKKEFYEMIDRLLGEK